MTWKFDTSFKNELFEPIKLIVPFPLLPIPFEGLELFQLYVTLEFILLPKTTLINSPSQNVPEGTELIAGVGFIVIVALIGVPEHV